MSKLQKKFRTDDDFRAQEAYDHNMIISSMLLMLSKKCGYATMMTTVCLINVTAASSKNGFKDNETPEEKLQSIHDISLRMINDKGDEND